MYHFDLLSPYFPGKDGESGTEFYVGVSVVDGTETVYTPLPFSPGSTGSRVGLWLLGILPTVFLTENGPRFERGGTGRPGRKDTGRSCRSRDARSGSGRVSRGPATPAHTRAYTRAHI